ncbi:glycoside hydrolase family 13 protein [Enterococcus termitis]|uniref:Alpha-amylase n=1 Tax=Enterococcus termitis TaxID=332950 RepID=A0A1E5H7C7_9ENTE|nr:alpha-glucosidase [Enterococcus termitis]OEG20766.1 glucohydrolase [Enterococcus termitis]OJG96718.1 alpha amylase [Enterococcus termitis]
MKIRRTWWKEAVGYQIYPRSFMDSANDGIGDLNGIRSKLDYLKELGIGFIWITPIYESPNVDNGYDISDYQKILSTFGTMEEFDLLLAEAHDLGIKVIMDLVINHTSNQHAWFLESRSSRKDDYRDYYIWADGTIDGPPNDWVSIFGGSAWEYDKTTNQYYLHVFAKEQPDLNWENPRVKRDLFKMIDWWLDKGIDGFRVDAISHIKKAPLETLSGEDPHAPYKNVLGIEKHLEELGDIFRKRDILTVGEANGVTADQAYQWVGEADGYFNMLFEFDHISLWNKNEQDGLDVVHFKKALTAWQNALADGRGWNALYMENHDIPRSVSSFGSEETVFWKASAKALALTFLLLQGTPFIYQGQEIGMTNMPFRSIDEIDAVDTKNFYYEMLQTGLDEEKAMEVIRRTARDNSRTPMQWTAEEFAGFSKREPWLRINPNKQEINVLDETHDPDSILNFYKEVIQLRNQNDALIYGSYTLYLPEHPQLFVYGRRLEQERYVIIINLSKEFASADLPENVRIEEWELVLCNLDSHAIHQHTIFAPYEARVYKHKKN